MKKKDKSLIKDYRPTLLFIEDLKFVDSILKEKSSKVEISADDYSYDSLDEFLNECKNTPNEFEIKSLSPYVSLEISNRMARLYCSTNDSESAGIFYIIDKRIKESAKLGFLSFILTKLFSFFFLFATSLSVTILMKNDLINLNYFIEISFLAIIVYGMIMYIDLDNHSRISLTYRNPSIGFLEKNKDTLIGNFIIGVLLLLVGYFIGKF